MEAHQVLRQVKSETRRRILELLKLHGPQTANQLAKELGMTAMGARGHLAALERDRLIAHRAEKRRMGRPAYVFELTELGDELFPRTYPQLASSLLDSLKALYGEEVVGKLFEKRNEQLLKEYRARLADKPLDERVKELARIRTEEGYWADWEALDDGTFSLREHNCAICQIAKHAPEACQAELDLFRAVLPDCTVAREQHMIQGDRMCTYLIRRRNERHDDSTS
jgi:iron-sulfur cluster biosynthesis transcriptional regulator SufR